MQHAIKKVPKHSTFNHKRKISNMDEKQKIAAPIEAFRSLLSQFNNNKRLALHGLIDGLNEQTLDRFINGGVSALETQDILNIAKKLPKETENRDQLKVKRKCDYCPNVAEKFGNDCSYCLYCFLHDPNAIFELGFITCK